MIVRTTAIPLAIFPYSSTSRIVHWITRHQGKISTLLKGALRPKSPFLGEYELFSTSELLYFPKRTETLHTAKECAILQRRDTFRTDWRAMQAASYLTLLVNRATPDESPQPELFTFHEILLDWAAEHGRNPHFLPWAELRFCDHFGQAPNLQSCVACSSGTHLRFCTSQGGLVCGACATARRLPTLDCPADVLAILRDWQKADDPALLPDSALRPAPQASHLIGAFMRYQFNLGPEPRNAAMVAA